MMWRGGLKILLSTVLFFGLTLPVHAKGYHSSLREWSRGKQLYSTTDVHVKIIANATFFSPEFRKVYVQRHLKKKYLDGMDASRFLEEQERRAANSHEFFVGMYAPKPYRSFSSGKDSFWEAILITASGETLKPVLVEQIDVTPYEKVMFPYLSRWTKAYRIVFPKAELGNEFKMTLRSVIGQTHLKWD